MNAAQEDRLICVYGGERNMVDCSATIRLVLTDELSRMCVAHDIFS